MQQVISFLTICFVLKFFKNKKNLIKSYFQFILAKLIYYIMLALNQQHLQQGNSQIGSAQNMKKIDLINLNMARFTKTLKLSSSISILRLGLFIIILIYQKTLISRQSDTQNTDTWSIIFYVMASLMDFLVVMNNSQMLKFMKYQAFRLLEIRNQLFSNQDNIPSTAIGPYTNYMSIYSIVTAYKLSSRLAVSISKTVRLLQTFSTFYVFAYLAVNSQTRSDGSLLPIIILWGFILSIYIQIIETDLSIVQNSSGPYIPPKTQVKNQAKQQQSKESALIKDVFIKKIRRPFQVAYVVNIIFILATTILFFQGSFFNLMCGLCIIAHSIQLIYEKHLQNKLMLFDLKSVPSQYLSSFLIMKYLNGQSWKLRLFITSFTRISIVTMIMAFFTRQTVGFAEQIVLIILNLTLYLAQKIKFHCFQQGKIYIIRSTIKQQQTQKQACDCSICLIDCQKGDRIVELPCFDSHVFHYTCMENWFVQRKQCPLCRYSLEIYDLVK